MRRFGSACCESQRPRDGATSSDFCDNISAYHGGTNTVTQLPTTTIRSVHVSFDSMNVKIRTDRSNTSLPASSAPSDESLRGRYGVTCNYAWTRPSTRKSQLVLVQSRYSEFDIAMRNRDQSERKVMVLAW